MSAAFTQWISIDWASFHFLRPWWLLALLPLLALMVLSVRRPAVSPAWARVCDPHLLDAMLADEAPGEDGAARARHRTTPEPRWPKVVAAIAGMITVLALAGPAWEQLPQPVFQTGEARVLIMDLSKSMDAADVPPSRLTRAKYAAVDLIDQLPDGDIALVVFAGSSFTVLPLTDDRETMRHMIRSLETSLMPVQGGRIGNALDDAVRLLEQSGAQRGDVILLTDSTPDVGTSASIAWMREQGHRLWIVGFGTTEGAPIPQDNGGWVKDSAGGIVLARLEPDALRRLAQEGGGRYQTLPADGLQARDFSLARGTDAQRADDDFNTDTWQDEGQRLVWLLLPLAALAFRRGWLVRLCLIAAFAPALLVATVAPAHADSLWQNNDQQARALLQQGDAEAAAKQFEDPHWRGVAHYEAGNFDAAAAAFSSAQSLDAQYNRGNALARAGALDEAIAAYDRVLSVDPDHADARFNRDLVRQLRDQQQSESEQSQGDESDQSDQGEQSDEGQQGSPSDQQQGDNSESGEQGSQDQSGDQRSDAQSDAQSQDGQQGDEGEEERDGEQPGEGRERDENEEDGQQTTADGELSEEERQAEEKAQAIEQWLRRVPDDPGGLLRRKFQRDQQRRGASEQDQGEQAW